MRAPVLGAACVLASIANAAPASAAEVRFDAPAACKVTRQNIEAQVERLVGRRLSEMDASEFDVRVRRVGRGWELVLRTKNAPAQGADESAHARQITGATCRELTDAAAVAIALAIEGRGSPEDTTQPWEAVPIERTGANEEHDAPEPTSSGPAAPNAAANGGSVSSTDLNSSEAAEGGAAIPLRMGLWAAALLDSAALPHPSAGASLGLLAELSAFRIELFGALFLPQRMALADGRGGEFDLMLGGLRACGRSDFGSIAILGCAGFEAGQLAGRGLHVRTAHPRNTGWFAVSAEAGAVWTVLPKLALLLRGGLAGPLSRPDFVLDGTQPVYRAAAISFRAALALEIYL